MALRYDRRASPELLAALAPGGFAHSLVEYGRSGQYALDLQLRGYSGKPGHWATLYVGLTKVLDLQQRPSGWKLDAHKTYKVAQHGWDPVWEASQPQEQLASSWAAVENYLERVIPAVGPRFLQEGAVQSALSSFHAQDMIVIDREAVITYSNDAERKATTARLLEPLLQAFGGAAGEPSWLAARPTSVGGEVDAIGITRDGVLRVIEVKPASSVKGITWAPLQVRHYANLFRDWLDSDPAAPAALQAMVDQRQHLGLVPQSGTFVVPPSVEVEPVVAIRRGASDEALRRMWRVRDRLVQAGFGDPEVRLMTVNLAGRLDDLPPSP